MDKTWQKVYETKKTLTIAVDEDQRKSGSDAVLTRTFGSPDTSLEWNVIITVSPLKAEKKWSLTMEISAVTPGNPKRYVRVMAQGNVSAAEHSNKQNNSGTRCCYCGSYGGNTNCQQCRSWLGPPPVQVEIPLTETCIFRPAPLVLSTKSSVGNLEVSLSMTHYSGVSTKPDLPLHDYYEPESLQDRLEVLLNSGLLSDVTFEVAGQEIPAHRVILGATSEVFCAMFSVDTRDKSTGRVVIKDSSPEAFKEMLRTIYTDSQPQWTDEDGLLLELLFLAEKYDLKSLKASCQERVLQTLSVDNVCSRLKVVEVVSPALIVPITIPFIKAHLREVLSSPAWIAFEKDNITLASKVMRTAITS